MSHFSVSQGLQTIAGVQITLCLFARRHIVEAENQVVDSAMAFRVSWVGYLKPTLFFCIALGLGYSLFISHTGFVRFSSLFVFLGFK